MDVSLHQRRTLTRGLSINLYSIIRSIRVGIRHGLTEHRITEERIAMVVDDHRVRPMGVTAQNHSNHGEGHRVRLGARLVVPVPSRHHLQDILLLIELGALVPKSQGIQIHNMIKRSFRLILNMVHLEVAIHQKRSGLWEFVGELRSVVGQFECIFLEEHIPPISIINL